MRSMIYGAAMAVSICIPSTQTWAVECPGSISDGMPKEQFFACFAEMQEEIKNLRQQLEDKGIKGRIDFLQEQTDRAATQVHEAKEAVSRAAAITSSATKAADDAQGIAGKANATLSNWQSREKEFEKIFNAFQEAGSVENFVTSDEFVERVASLVDPVPPFAVLAFDDPNGCPRGWTKFGDAEGRVLLAAGAGPGLSGREFRSVGGQEKVALTAREMPVHKHTARTETGGSHDHMGESGGTLRGVRSGNGVGGNGGSWVTAYDPIRQSGQHRHGVQIDTAGRNAPHNNMPPFVALYFCKRS